LAARGWADEDDMSFVVLLALLFTVPERFGIWSLSTTV